MRKHGWQLPYHPLQVVAIVVFLALGFAFYVFFAPFVGKKMFQYIVMGIYTPLIVSAFGLYIWCAAADPADPGVFKSKKYLKIPETGKHTSPKDSKLGGESTASLHDASAVTCGGKSVTKDLQDKDAASICSTVDAESKISSERPSCFLLACSPCTFIWNCCGSSKESSIQQVSEEGKFYCSLCEVEVFKYSKHCRVCDKCVNHFDHHCRWLNNCIGKRNYRQFFALMVASLLLLILQWTTGILVLICCFLERKQFSVDISAKLGSSFSLVPFVIVVAVCTFLAMIATLQLVQLLFFHILLIKKGISTYDYIIALREQEQEQEGVGVQQSPQLSPASSLTGLSSAGSFTNFHRGAWCTPPRLFLEDQFDVVPPDTGSVSSYGKKVTEEESNKKKNPGAVKISPWTLARLNAEEVSKAAAEARKRSKILQPVTRHDGSFRLENEGSFGSSSGRRMFPRPENNRKQAHKWVRLQADPPVKPLTKVSSSKALEKGFTDTSTSLAPLQLEAWSAFQRSQVISSSSGIVASSPESSLDSPDVHPFRLSSSGAEEARQLTGLSGLAFHSGFPLSRSTSDGYEASGGEDSDHVPYRITQRSTNWSNVLFGSDRDERIVQLKASSSTEVNLRKP